MVTIALLVTAPAWAGSGIGMASYYGGKDGLCGKRTANGQRLNCNAMTAAHRRLPFGTPVRVTHGNRTVTVVITDRGPFRRGRVLDVSLGAARALGLHRRGVGRIRYEY